MAYDTMYLKAARFQALKILNLLVSKRCKCFLLSPLAFSGYQFSCGNILSQKSMTLKVDKHTSKSNVWASSHLDQICYIL